ncbi:DUF5615 family PIN-like protein [Alkalinema pantanalense CENA528]|uniref:DUF5615 family PIN-like protein n=1 Tax=Alkalinema pantanalense TaxID=1620705 RepID=UPI003D6E8679
MSQPPVKVKFLLDENLSPKFQAAILRQNPQIDILRVGDAGAPAFGTPDPNLLDYLEIAQRILVTDNRKSMPGHLQDHWAKGGHTWGILWLKPGSSLTSWVSTIVLIWEVSDAAEWRDRLDWIPL